MRKLKLKILESQKMNATFLNILGTKFFVFEVLKLEHTWQRLLGRFQMLG